MATMSKVAPDIDTYIASFPKEVQAALQSLRRTVREIAPGAEEAIRYAMPAFILNGHLALFAAFKNHIGFYPAPTGVKAFEKDLAGYKTGRGSVQFPLDKPMPLELVKKMVKYQLKKNAEKGKASGSLGKKAAKA
ncbi:DUF1801 domain-containing protein [Paraflavitalea sp. CAU 1676]|uniref:iron chaperone n=1 Tax=Paraflavitalea sp. CAU 1676 TaxID=3032598 RepID=UPI0023DA416D|nr:DUF1801 domain-containing protein [Paraflavitalea sp. CAU 1676]MDF2192372.1 DUF1801 domain-containing protein [Paraflavitalea sp. CAU 1676]